MNPHATVLGDPPQSSVAWDRVIGAVVFLGLIPSWFGLLGGFHWFPDLFSHFRWQYLFACLPMLAWALWRRQRVLSLLTTATLLLNAWLIGSLALPSGISRDDLADDFRLSVLSLNVLTSNPGMQKVIDHVIQADADFVFLMEVDNEWADELRALDAKYPHHFTQPRRDNFGVAIFSRVPWKSPPVVWYASAEVPSVDVQLTHQGRDLMIVATHPLPPAGRRYAIKRNQQLRQLVERIAGQSDPVLVLGDLNATPWSAGMRIVQDGGRIGYRSLEAPWTPTWRSGSIFAIPIDHILCTTPLVLENRTIGPDVGSDHRSVRADVRWAKQ